MSVPARALAPSRFVHALLLTGAVAAIILIGSTLSSCARPGKVAAQNAVLYGSIAKHGEVSRLFVMRDRTAKRLALGGPTVDTMWPSVSPDGRRIVYVRTDASDLHSTLHVCAWDGTGDHPLSSTDSEQDQYTPAWSPRGDLIAYEVGSGPQRGLSLIAPDGGGGRRLSGLPRNATEPAWSPDGRQLVFATWSHGHSYLAVTAVDGGTYRAIVDREDGAWEPAWSPDGVWIAFRSSNGNGGDSIFAVRPDGSGLRRLTDASDTRSDAQPAWSPDGKRLYFWTTTWGWGGLWRLTVVDAPAALSSGGRLGPNWGADWHSLPAVCGPQGEDLPDNPMGLVVIPRDAG